jgi:hypothetical protein
MAALKWTIILLAFQLMGLFDSKSITAAPVYNSEESQNSGMRDSTLVDTSDNITDTYEINTHNEGNDDDGAVEKDEDQISSKEGQKVENENKNEPGVSVTETLSNPVEDSDITVETSDEGEHVNREEAHDQKVNTGVASNVDEDNGAAHDHEVTSAAHNNEEDTEAPHEDNEDTGAAHDDGTDIGTAHKDNEDTGPVHDNEEDTEAPHKDNGDTGAAHDDGTDIGTAHKDNEDTGEAHEDNTGENEDTSATHKNNDTGAAQGGADDTGAGNNNEEHTHRESNHESDYNAEHNNEADFGIEYVHKENHIAAHKDKGKYTAISHEAFKEQLTDSSGINENGLAPHMHHEEATAGLVPGVPGSWSYRNGTASSEDENAEGRDIVDGQTEAEEVEEEEEMEEEDEEEEGDGDNSDYGLKTGNSGVAEDSLRSMLERKEDKNNDNLNSKESDSNTDTTDIHGGSNNESFVAELGGTGNVKSDDDEEDDSVSERTHEYNVTKSVTGSENSTVVPGSQLQKEDIRRQGEDGVNELGHESKSEDSEYSKSSTGSFVVLGLIMGTIVVLLAYSVFKSRWRNTRESKTEDFGTELADVKKTLLPQNEFNGGIHPTIRPEEDESNAKLFPDTQYKGNNAENEEAHKVEAATADYGVQNKKDGHGDSRPKLDIDFDRIETQSESDAINNTLKSDFQENTKSFPDVVTPKKVEAVDDQSRHHPLQSKKTPDKNFNPHFEKSIEPFPRVVTPNKAETADVPSAQHLLEPPTEAANNAFKTSSREDTNSIPKAVTPEKVETTDVSSHQNGYNNVNGVSEVVVETQPSAPAQNNYVIANTGGMVTMPGRQVYTPVMPVTCVTATIVDRQPYSYVIEYRN